VTKLDPQKDYYAILELTPEADTETLKRAYRELARRHHPDSGSGDVEAFRLVQEAYDVLRDTALRRAYDRQRGRRGRDAEGPINWTMTLSRETLPALATQQMLYALVEIVSTAKETAGRQPLNLALVVDRSNSMRGIRMENVKLAALDLLDYLEPGDRLAMIAFNDRAEVLIPSTLASDKRNLRSPITSLVAGGGTEIYQGLLAGIEQVRRFGNAHKVNHVILLTDGRTYGDEERSLQEVQRATTSGIGVSAMGIGEDWNDFFLDNLAQRGGGISSYIQSPSQIRQMLRDHLQGLGSLLARDLKFVTNLTDYVQVQAVHRVLPHMEHLGTPQHNTIAVGRLEADQPIALLLDLLVEHNEVGRRRLARFELEGMLLKGDKPLRLRHDLEVTFAHSPQESPVPPRILNHLSRLSVYRLQERAWLALESGDAKQATSLLNVAATRLFDMGYRDLAQAALLEAGRMAQGAAPSSGGRKKLRYGTRALSIPTHTEPAQTEGVEHDR